MTAGWLLLFIIPVLCQQEKPIGTWNVNLAEKYPNPMMDADKCKTLKPSGLCDPNGMLNSSARNNINDKLEEMESTTYIDKHIKMRVAVMKVFGPQIANPRAEAEMFAPAFRRLWNLCNYTVIVIASVDDNVSFVDAGSDVEEFLWKNVTDNIDRLVSEEFMKGHHEQGITMAVKKINGTAMKRVQEWSAQQYDAQTTETSNQEMTTTTPPYGIIIGVGVILVIAGLGVIAFLTYRFLKQRKLSEKGPISGASEPLAPRVDV